jgi:hypothetical protein
MWSCEKEAQLTPTIATVQNTDSNIEFVNGVTDNFTTEYASFQSEEEMTKFTMAYLGLTYEEQEEVLGKLKFQTLNDYISTAYDGMITLETERDFEEYVNNYADYLEIVPIANGEREVVEKESRLYLISPFINVDKIVKVGDTFTKYIGNYIVESTEAADLKRIKSSNDIVGSGLNYTNLSSNSRQDLFGPPKEYEKENDKRWCKDDRKVILEVWFIQNPATSGVGKDYVPTVKATAKRKGIPCIWYKQTTDITWNNFHFKISVDGIPDLDWTLPNFTVNAKDFTVTSPQGAIYSGYPSNAPDVIWTKQRSDVKTPGMGNKWLVVDL